jgi:hypothetical protein
MSSLGDMILLYVSAIPGRSLRTRISWSPCRWIAALGRSNHCAYQTCHLDSWKDVLSLGSVCSAKFAAIVPPLSDGRSLRWPPGARFPYCYWVFLFNATLRHSERYFWLITGIRCDEMT